MDYETFHSINTCLCCGLLLFIVIGLVFRLVTKKSWKEPVWKSDASRKQGTPPDQSEQQEP